jgi:anti-anti-sigma regulatory factor
MRRSGVMAVRWRRRGAPADGPQAEPVVLTVTDPVTRESAADLVTRVSRIAPGTRVVIDLTAIPAFDTEGTAALVGLQEEVGADRVAIIGFRQAAARLLGAADVDLPTLQMPAPRGSWVVRRLRAIAVVQAADDLPPPTDGLDQAARDAINSDAAIVVIDLRGVTVRPEDTHAIAFASSEAAVRGQELLVVNVDGAAAEAMRRIGLSATTYLSPLPLPD